MAARIKGKDVEAFFQQIGRPVPAEVQHVVPEPKLTKRERAAKAEPEIIYRTVKPNHADNAAFAAFVIGCMLIGLLLGGAVLATLKAMLL